MLVSFKTDESRASEAKKLFKEQNPEYRTVVIDYLFSLRERQTGLYITSDFNHKFTLELYVAKPMIIEEFDGPLYPEFKVPSYGVCDTPFQFYLRYRKYLTSMKPTLPAIVVAFNEVLRSVQPKKDGWRWEKWGPYVGRKKPKADYLHDEPNISSVYCFKIYEINFPENIDLDETYQHYSKIDYGVDVGSIS